MMTQDLTEVDFRAQMKHRSRCQVCLHGMTPLCVKLEDQEYCSASLLVYECIIN